MLLQYCIAIFLKTDILLLLQCNVAAIFRNVSAIMQFCKKILLQCCCNIAVLYVFYNCLVYVHSRTISISLLKKCPYQLKNKDIMTFIRGSLIYKKYGIM